MFHVQVFEHLFSYFLGMSYLGVGVKIVFVNVCCPTLTWGHTMPPAAQRGTNQDTMLLCTLSLLRVINQNVHRADLFFVLNSHNITVTAREPLSSGGCY